MRAGGVHVCGLEAGFLVGCDESNNSHFSRGAMCDLGIMEPEFFPIQLDIRSHFGGITAAAAA